MAMTDIWFRNPDRCMTQLASEGVNRITWTRQHLGRLRMDGIAYVRQFYMHTPIRPKIMLIGVQGTSEYHLFSKLDAPVAVYPTWAGKHDSVDELLDMIERPWGDDMDRCSDLGTPSSLRPIWGQKHRVIIHNAPSAQSGPGRKFWIMMNQIQQDHPDVELFVNGSKSFAVMFGLNFLAADEGMCDAGDNNKTFRLPNGVAIHLDKGVSAIDKLMQFSDWVKLLGFEPHELVSSTGNRYTFRIRSARWAAKHWRNNFRWHLKNRNLALDELEASDDDYQPTNQTHSIVLRRKQYTMREADKILCDRCRIQAGCRFYRAESICGMKDSEMAELEKYFDSRNAGRIVDGLAHIVRLQARRLEQAIDNEASDPEGEIDPEVTKMMKTVFDSGVKLAKLVDPQLAGPGTRVQVNVGTAASTEVIAGSDPRQLMSVIVDTLEKGGIKREEITPQMVAGVLQGMANQSQQQAIEAQVISHEDFMGNGAVSSPEQEVEKVQVASTRCDA